MRLFRIIPNFISVNQASINVVVVVVVVVVVFQKGLVNFILTKTSKVIFKMFQVAAPRINAANVKGLLNVPDLNVVHVCLFNSI